MSNSIPNVSIAVASSNPKDFSKKKRANRSAKLKQCKLDVRREQWLSQVKRNDDRKEEIDGGGSASNVPSPHSENIRGKPVEKLEIKTKNEDIIYENGPCDSGSLPSSSPTSRTSSVLGSNDSGANFTATSRSSSCSINGFCSGDDDDDWEAVADALEAKDKKQPENEPENASEMDNISNANSASGGNRGSTVSCCAWRPGDAYRPQNLPNLSKNYSFSPNSERRVVPTSCPICFEDLDCTDSSFLPCSCGFRLCLFCHKRIIEEDGRCPGCRKKYECEAVEREASLDGGILTFRLTRSCSTITRSS